MKQPGIGAMIHRLSGGSDESPDKYYGRKIIEADINEDRLRLKFDDKIIIKIWDDGQSCCEHRYITCDDDVSKLIGGALRIIEVVECKEVEDDEYGECHEQPFINVGTEKITITFCTHNEHNGYYGGFGLSVTEIES